MTKIRFSKKYNCGGTVVSGATILKLLKEAKPAETPDVSNDFINVNDLVWNNAKPFAERLEILTNALNKYKEMGLFNDKKLSFNIYHDFVDDLSKLCSENRQFHELELAIEVLKIVKRWYRKYDIDVKKLVPITVFRDFFKDTVDTNPWKLNTYGMNLYNTEEVTAKTLINWANKLTKLGIITEEKLNSFLDMLEQKYKKQ